MRGLVALLLAAGLAAGQDVDQQSIERWLEVLRPTAEEQAWQSIRWRPSLAAAVPEAHAARKPILLWAMNGHPLACT